MTRMVTVAQRNWPTLFDLTGQVALVVGGYGALGQTIVRALAEAGAGVVIAGRSQDRAETLADMLKHEGKRADGLTLDATDISSTRNVLSTLLREQGSLDILVNCLGVQREQSLLDVTEDAFDEVYQTNLKASMFLAQSAARCQAAAGRGGRHIHLLSIRAQLGYLNRGYSALCATKGGQAALIRQHAVELASHNVTVNGIAPSAVHTHKNDKALADPDTYDRMTRGIPLGRIATPQDVAGAVLFLASPASSFVTGQVLYVDGGISSCR